MSEGFASPSSQPAPAPRVRPPTVTVANLLLLVVAAVYVISFIMTISITGTMRDVFEEAFAGTEAEGGEGFAVGIFIGIAAIYLLVAIGLVVLAVLNNQGKNPARIVTWVIGGIGLCCTGISLLTSGVGGGGSFGGTGTDGVDQEELERQLQDALPSWYEPATLAFYVIAILALAGALLLLALPPSNEFFRKKEPPFEPPAPDYPQVG
jgi:hypothetical protein